MGVSYYLINNGNNTIFELGKGSWASIFLEWNFGDKNNLLEVLSENFLYQECAYILWLRDRIFDFIGEIGDESFIEICDDEGDKFLDFLDNENYEMVGNRYWNNQKEKEDALFHIHSFYGFYGMRDDG